MKQPSPPFEKRPSGEQAPSRPADDGAPTTLPLSGLYRMLVENIADYAIFALDLNGHVATWNLGAERFKGYSESEIVGKHFSIFYTPEDIAAGLPAHLLRIAAEEGHVGHEGWRVRKDGTRFWADVVITALRSNAGKLVGYAKITRDLTERRRADEVLRLSEERFRLIVQSVGDYAIFMLDTKGCVASWNEGAHRINGYSEAEILGRHFSTFYPSKDVASGKPAMELKSAALHGSYEDEDWRVRKDGTQFWANVIITPLRNADGHMVGYGKVVRDLTERKAAEERAIADARRVAEAESSNRIKSEFLAAMSHELRTPLNAISGYAELIEMGLGGPVTERQREYIDRIRTSQKHLLAIINDLLNYSRIEAGQLTYETEWVDLERVIQTVHAMVAAQATLKRIRLEQGASEPAVAVADRLKVEQVVLNLVSNALKFTPEGGTVSTRCRVSDVVVSVEVQDTGIGIEPERIDEIFEPFVQLGRSLKSVQEGTGLGLAISRDLARGMGGDVRASSMFGQGSAFTVTLPRARPGDTTKI